MTLAKLQRMPAESCRPPAQVDQRLTLHARLCWRARHATRGVCAIT